MKKFPTLYKRAVSGKTVSWQISVRDVGDGTAEIVVVHGYVDGKQQTVRDLITEGKNEGRTNSTTPLEQAIAEAQSAWTHRKDRGHYGEDVEGNESAGKRALAPMLAQTYEHQAGKVDWNNAYAQPKYDGNRCLARKDGGVVVLTSRTGKVFDLPHIEEALQCVMRSGDVFDGEIYQHGVPLNEIRSLVTRYRSESEKLQYHIYDAPIDAPFLERSVVIQGRMTKAAGSVLSRVPTIRVATELELMKFQADCIAEGYEGAMLRWGEAPYEAGKRSQSLLKVKTFMDAEFCIVDVREGRGTFKGMAIFACLTKDGNEFEVTAPGTHDEKRYAWEHRAECIGKMLTVKFQFMTKTDFPVPFLPVAIRVRD